MAGDQKAFAILVDRHVSGLSALAAQMLGDVHMAEDIVQSVFLKTWQMLPKWETGNAKLITWMRRVTVNACLDHLRKHKPVYTDRLPDTPSRDNDPEQNLNQSQKRSHIKTMMLALPERQSAAMSLFYFQELSLQDSAEVMNISPSAFESLLRRARTTFKKQLQTNETHDEI